MTSPARQQAASLAGSTTEAGSKLLSEIDGLGYDGYDAGRVSFGSWEKAVAAIEDEAFARGKRSVLPNMPWGWDDLVAGTFKRPCSCCGSFLDSGDGHNDGCPHLLDKERLAWALCRRNPHRFQVKRPCAGHRNEAEAVAAAYSEKPEPLDVGERGMQASSTREEHDPD